MVWRPVALMRGPMRRRGRVLDVVAVLGLAGLGALMWYLHVVTPDGADPWLFRGGFVLTAVATLAVIAAVTHQGHAASARPWATRCSCGSAPAATGCTCTTGRSTKASAASPGTRCRVPEFAVAMAATLVVTELSYRLVETPIRRGTYRRWWQGLQRSGDDGARRLAAVTGAVVDRRRRVRRAPAC